MNLDKVREELSFLSNQEVLLFGSCLTSEFDPNSDIDVAIIARSEDPAEMMRIRVEASGKASEKYDIQVFEQLPLIIKGTILENFETLFGNPLEIGMYLYKFRKQWDDYSHRIEVPTIDEIRRGMQRHRS